MAVVGDVAPFSSVRSRCQNLQQLASQSHGSSSALSTCQQLLGSCLAFIFESFHCLSTKVAQ